MPAGVLCELMAILTGSPLLSYMACSLFVFHFTQVFLRLEWYARILASVTVVTLVMLALLGKLTWPLLGKAAESAAFFATFLGSLGLMQLLVRRFEFLRRIHDALLSGRTTLLYPKYAITSFGVASVLSFGVLNMLCGGLAQTLDQRQIEGQARLDWLRSLLGVTLRGFALVPLVAPTSVAVAIITREVPALSWSSLVPYTAVAALLFLAVGSVLERHRFKAISGQRVHLGGIPAGTSVLLAFVGTLFGGIGLLVFWTPLNVSRAAMILVPVLTVFYLLVRERRPSALARELTSNMLSQSNEMMIFASSAALGGTLASLVPAQVIGAAFVSPQGEFAFAVTGMLILPAAAAIGIAPMAVLSFLAGILAQFQSMGLSPLTGGAGLAIGFSLAMMLSPFGPSVMILARFGRISKFTVAFGWNGFFTLAALPLMLVLLAWMAW
ncbi:hypothetical protein GCM10022278_13560 [Allohahella marinimesophila]|uniref:Uncharacterized protein n=1 Tax=Allohahella marinimesophila TaxID=1054972 RepID=A0ABP7NXS1_9GAMM